MQSVKTVVLGAWADGSSWSKIIPLLEAEGLHVAALQNPLSSIADDVASRILEDRSPPFPFAPGGRGDHRLVGECRS